MLNLGRSATAGPRDCCSDKLFLGLSEETLFVVEEASSAGGLLIARSAGLEEYACGNLFAAAFVKACQGLLRGIATRSHSIHNQLS
jgi:hypothetical protein